jgi:hypothetical protein
MNFFLGILFGFLLALSASVFAQSGSVMDSQGGLIQFYTFPGGATQYRDSQGRAGTLYQTPDILPRPLSPC